MIATKADWCIRPAAPNPNSGELQHQKRSSSELSRVSIVTIPSAETRRLDFAASSLVGVPTRFSFRETQNSGKP